MNWKRIKRVMLWTVIYVCLFGLVAVCCLGCTTVKYGGFTYTKWVYGQEIQSLKVTLDPNDPNKILSWEMEGQKSSNAILGDIVKLLAGYKTGTQVSK